MGHKVELTTEYDRFVFGRGQIIQRDPKSGVSVASCSVCTQANACIFVCACSFTSYWALLVCHSLHVVTTSGHLCRL